MCAWALATSPRRTLLKAIVLLVHEFALPEVGPRGRRGQHSNVALVLSFIAAVGYGGGAVLQAAGVRRANAKGSEGLVGLVQQPLFLIGLLADFGSWLVSRFALHSLPLFVVQSILAGSLAVTVLLARLVLGVALRTPERLAIAATVVGIAIVGVSAGDGPAQDITQVLKISILLGIPAIGALGFIAVRMKKSVLLAVLAGTGFTGSALAARAVRIDDVSIVGVLTEPLLWAVLVYAILALAMHAIALINGTVGAVTATMWSTEVLIAAVIGFVALGDHVRPHFLVPALFGIALMLAATIVMSRSPAQDLEHLSLPYDGELRHG